MVSSAPFTVNLPEGYKVFWNIGYRFFILENVNLHFEYPSKDIFPAFLFPSKREFLAYSKGLTLLEFLHSQ